MALKDRLRSKRSKRTTSVLNDFDSKEEEMNPFSSDSRSETVIRKTKVRKGFSTNKLMKESECYIVDNDHMYTCLSSPGTDYNPIRKRKFSEDSDGKPIKKGCISKNALMAKLNRERKKLYISSLETENESLRKEKNDISRKVEEQNKKISAMSHEILYLKGLLANSKELVLILRNLREMTGLPVTSSMIHATNNGMQDDPSKTSQSLAEEHNKNQVEYQPRIKSVNSGYNFPILDKDINLGSCSDISFNNSVDLENSPFDFEDFSCDLSQATSKEEDNDNSSYFSFCSTSLNSDLEQCFQLGDLSKSSDPQVGICLHVNQKKISVEICSICSGKAASSLDEFSNEVFAV